MIRSIKLWKPAVAGTLTTAGTLLFAPSAMAATVSKGILDDIMPSLVTSNTASLLGVIITLINIFLFVAGVVAFVYAIWGGFQYITAGSDDEKATNGRKTITNAVIGLIIIGLAFLIIRFATGFASDLGSSTTGELNPTAAPGFLEN